MAINEETRQLEVAREAAETLRTLAHSTRDVPNPQASYELLGELGAIIDHAAQVADQLARWHQAATEGTHHAGEDNSAHGSAQTAAAELRTTANALRLASNHVQHAHSANALVRWYPERREAGES